MPYIYYRILNKLEVLKVPFLVLVASLVIYSLIVEVPSSYSDIKQPTEAQVFDEINRLRAEEDLTPLTWDSSLYELSSWKARDMTERDYYSHFTPEGKTTDDYFKRPHPNFVEALMYGVNTGGKVNPINSWMESPVHRESLMDPLINRGAVSTDGPYWVFVGIS